LGASRPGRAGGRGKAMGDQGISLLTHRRFFGALRRILSEGKLKGVADQEQESA